MAAQDSPTARLSLTPRLARGLLLAALLLLLLLLAARPLATALVVWQVEAATGRELSLDGWLELRPGLLTHAIAANGVVLGNADWGESPHLFKASRVDIEWRPLALLRGEFVLARVRLDDPDLRLERDASLRANWRFSDDPVRDPLPGWLPRVDALQVANGRLDLLEATRRTELSVKLESGDPTAPGRQPPLDVAGGGRYRDQPFDLQGRISSPLRLLETAPDARYWIDLRATAGETKARVAGGLRSVLQLQDFELDFAIEGPDMAALYPLLGLAIPETAAYALDGRLGRAGTTWHYRDMRGTVGNSDLAGDVAVHAGRSPKLFEADLVSQTLDLDDLAGFVGGRPQADDGRAGRVFPDRPYDTEKLRAMDARVSLVAQTLRAPPLPFESMDATLRLEGGELNLDPIRFGFAGGRVGGTVQLDARQDPMQADIRLEASGLQLPRLLPDAEAASSQGALGGRVALAGQGASVAAIMASADGEAGLVMGRGRISNYLMELMGLDIAEMIRFKLGQDRQVVVHCAYADFEVADGVAEARALAFDTSDTLVRGEGSVDLGRERFDLVLEPRPKDRSPLSLRSPLALTGSFRDPSVAPQGGPLLLRGAAAAALYALAPPAALLALVETGPGGNADCGGKGGADDGAPDEA